MIERVCSTSLRCLEQTGENCVGRHGVLGIVSGPISVCVEGAVGIKGMP